MGAQLRESSDLGSRSTFREPLLEIKILERNSRRLPHWSAMQLQAPPVIHLLIRARHPTAFCCSAKGIGGWLHSAPRLATKWWNEHHHWFYTTCFNLPPLHSTQLWICVHPRWVKSLCENSFVQIIIRHLTFIVSKIGIGIFAGLLKVDAIKKCNGSSYLLRTGMVTMEESKKRWTMQKTDTIGPLVDLAWAYLLV